MSNQNWDQKLAKSRQQACRPWFRWTQAEHRYLIEATLRCDRDEDIAFYLGRSISAVQLRRYHLRQLGLVPPLAQPALPLATAEEDR